MPPTPIYCNNDWNVRVRLSAFVPSTSGRGPATGLNSLRACLSWTAGGPPIHADLQVTLAEGQPGDYSGLFSGAKLTEHLAAAPANQGRTVYERVWIDGPSGATGEFDESRPLVIVFTRRGT